MRFRRMGPGGLLAIPFAVLVLAVVLWSGAATARKMPINPGQFVNVNVGVSIQMPLADESEETLVNAQRDARKFIYRMASKECTTLKATIAKTCRMTNLNISSQIREHGNQGAVKLYLNGNAQFSITLKDADAN